MLWILLCLYGIQVAMVAWAQNVPVKSGTVDNVTIKVYRPGSHAIGYVPMVGFCCLAVGTYVLYAEYEGRTYYVTSIDIPSDVNFGNVRIERKENRVSLYSFPRGLLGSFTPDKNGK